MFLSPSKEKYWPIGDRIVYNNTLLLSLDSPSGVDHRLKNEGEFRLKLYKLSKSMDMGHQKQFAIFLFGEIGMGSFQSQAPGKQEGY